jgi:hypothetical protein
MSHVVLVRGRAVVLALTVAAPLASSVTCASAQTTRTRIAMPAVLIVNQCNNDPVALSGYMDVKVTTTPSANGTTTIASTASMPNLRGTGLASGRRYRAVDTTQTHKYLVAPPLPSTFHYKQWTVLRPRPASPSVPKMYLVFEMQGVIVAGALVPSLLNASISCSVPVDDPHGVLATPA